MKSAGDMTTAAVLGAGTMGAGIAQVVAGAGLDVRLHDVTEELATRGKERIAAGLAGQVAKGKMEESARAALLARITPVSGVSAACAGADLVIEAAPEKEDLKREIFAEAAASAGADALLATNTSSLSVSRLGAAVQGPARFIGLHFFNPPPVMKLLEIVIGEATAPVTVSLAKDLALRFGKDPIVVRDSPGFASSRLGLALGLEAMRMVEEGVASAADIDKAMVLGYRHPMGPLELTDLVGLDVRLAIAEYLAGALDDRRFEPPALLRRLVAEGHVGKKSGQGFHRWVEGKVDAT